MPDNKKSWDAYWQSGLKTSCVSNHKDGYPKPLVDFWKNKVLTYIKDDHRIIDLCTGGGGVPELMINAFAKDNIRLNIMATDLSSIQAKSNSVSRINITYVPDCNCESLPFDDNDFDLMTSNYGIEYSNIYKTMNQINRCLKSDGIFAAVLHTENSEIVKNAEIQKNQGEFILNELDYFKTFKNYYLKQSGSVSVHKKHEQRLSLCLEEIKKRLLIEKNQMALVALLKASEDVFLYGQKSPAGKAISYINQMELSFKHNLDRMKNLLAVVLSDKGFDEFETAMKKNGFKVQTHEPCLGEGNVVGGFGRGVVYRKL